MNDTITLTLQQVDSITMNLNKASSISQLLISCGSDDGQKPEALDKDSVFVVMQILSEELATIEKVFEAARNRD